MNNNGSKYSDEQILIENVIKKDPVSVEKIMPKLRKLLRFVLYEYRQLNNDNLDELVLETFAAAFLCKVPKLNCTAAYYLSKIGEKIWLYRKRGIKEIPFPNQYFDSLPSDDRVMAYAYEEDFILNLAKSKLSELCHRIFEYYLKGYDSEIASKRAGIANKKIYQSRKYECIVELKKHYNRFMRLTKNKYD